MRRLGLIRRLDDRQQPGAVARSSPGKNRRPVALSMVARWRALQIVRRRRGVVDHDREIEELAKHAQSLAK
jgi:hypothetical protein